MLQRERRGPTPIEPPTIEHSHAELRTPQAEVVSIPQAEVVERRRSEPFNMPARMLNVLREERILDLLAYLRGDPQTRRPMP